MKLPAGELNDCLATNICQTNAPASPPTLIASTE